MVQVDPDAMKLVGFQLRLAFEGLTEGLRKFVEAHEEAVQNELAQMRLCRSRADAKAEARNAEYLEWKRQQEADRG